MNTTTIKKELNLLYANLRNQIRAYNSSNVEFSITAEFIRNGRATERIDIPESELKPIWQVISNYYKSEEPDTIKIKFMVKGLNKKTIVCNFNKRNGNSIPDAEFETPNNDNQLPIVKKPSANEELLKIMGLNGIDSNPALNGLNSLIQQSVSQQLDEYKRSEYVKQLEKENKELKEQNEEYEAYIHKHKNERGWKGGVKYMAELAGSLGFSSPIVQKIEALAGITPGDEEEEEATETNTPSSKFSIEDGNSNKTPDRKAEEDLIFEFIKQLPDANLHEAFNLFTDLQSHEVVLRSIFDFKELIKNFTLPQARIILLLIKAIKESTNPELANDLLKQITNKI